MSIYNNQLSCLPSELSTLTSLEVLYLSDNKLTTLPSELSGLTALQEFDISNNQLSGIPPELSKLTTLQTLSLSRNAFAGYNDYENASIPWRKLCTVRWCTHLHHENERGMTDELRKKVLMTLMTWQRVYYDDDNKNVVNLRSLPWHCILDIVKHSLPPLEGI